MHETPHDLAALQELLDGSYAEAGTHLRSIITPERRMDAPALAGRLTGVCLLALAPVTADGRPLVGPVDGLFYRGEFWFGSGADSVRFRHIRRRSAVSATHVDGEAFAVTVHGRAHITPVTGAFRDYCQEVYGPGWRYWGDDALYARIEADRMFTFLLEGDG